MPGYNSGVKAYHSDRFENVNVVVLAGGVGGAKLLDGFAQIVPAGKLTAVVNNGDNFRHMGLAICPLWTPLPARQTSKPPRDACAFKAGLSKSRRSRPSVRYTQIGNVWLARYLTK